jgi:hypothetical protein
MQKERLKRVIAGLGLIGLLRWASKVQAYYEIKKEVEIYRVLLPWALAEKIQDR